MVSNGFSFIFCVDFVPHGLIWVFCNLQGGRESRIQEKINKAFIGEIVLTNYSVIWQKVQ
jgi:hypothetical protein